MKKHLEIFKKKVPTQSSSKSTNIRVTNNSNILGVINQTLHCIPTKEQVALKTNKLKLYLSDMSRLNK